MISIDLNSYLIDKYYKSICMEKGRLRKDGDYNFRRILKSEQIWARWLVLTSQTLFASSCKQFEFESVSLYLEFYGNDKFSNFRVF